MPAHTYTHTIHTYSRVPPPPLYHTQRASKGGPGLLQTPAAPVIAGRPAVDEEVFMAGWATAAGAMSNAEKEKAKEATTETGPPSPKRPAIASPTGKGGMPNKR